MQFHYKLMLCLFAFRATGQTKVRSTWRGEGHQGRNHPLGKTPCQNVPWLQLVDWLFMARCGRRMTPSSANGSSTPSKSKLSDEMKVESAGGNKCAFDFGETIVADRTDPPGNFLPALIA